MTTTFEGYVHDEGGQVINIMADAYGAKGDTVLKHAGGTIAAGSNVFTQTDVPFVATDVGKIVTVQGAGLDGAVLTSKITQVLSGTQVRLEHVSLQAATNTGYTFGTDDTAAINRALAESRKWGTVYAPAGIYTILGSSNDRPKKEGGQLVLHSRGGLVGQGGKYDPHDPNSRANTIFLCADANIGLMVQGHGTYEGFMVDGNNIATVPLITGASTGPNITSVQKATVPTGGLPTGAPTGAITDSGISYGRFTDVWVTRSAGNGWTNYGAQNITWYDCGATDCALDGMYFDAGTGGHDLVHFYERGSLRYGIHLDVLLPTTVGFKYQVGDVQWFGGTFDNHPTRQGVSKVFMRGALECRVRSMRIDGSNLSGPTVDLDQTLGYSLVFEGCSIASTPKGTNPGNACIQIGGTASDHRQIPFVKIDGCSFTAGDNSVLITQNNSYYLYPSLSWIVDNTTYGPNSDAPVDVDLSVQHATLPGPDVLLTYRTGKWYEATPVAPWSGSVHFRIMSEGWVQLRGRLEAASAAAGKMFTLPRGYRPRGGAPQNLLAALTDTSESTFGAGTITIENGDPTNVNAGAVAFKALAGAPAFPSGVKVNFDGLRFAVRGNTGQNW